VTQVWLCLLVLRSFRPSDPLRPAWLLIALSAASRVACGLLVQVLGTAWLLNPLVWFGRADSALLDRIRWSALVLGGPLQMALLAAGLLAALRVLGRFGFCARPRIAGWALAAGVLLITLGRFGETAAALLAGRQPDPQEVVALAGCPVLCVLLLEALLLWRSSARMGHGLIAKCWGAFAIGIFLSGFGEVAFWALSRWNPAWPVAAFGWYVWFPAAAAFALAPAYHVAAVRRAAGRTAQLSNSLTPRAFPRAAAAH
jgi:hypothetical protein